MSTKSLPGIEETRKAIHQVLRAWNLANPKDLSFFAGFLAIRELGFDERLPPTKKWQLVKQALEECLNQLNDRQPLQAELLSRRFIQNEGMQQVALSINISQDYLNRLQREAMDGLAQIWLANEELARSARGENLFIALPPRSYERLFGVKQTEAKLVDLLLEPAAPTMIALTGIGGIGKTALADSVVRTVLPEFVYTSVIWLRAESIGPNSLSFKDLLIGELARRLLPDAISTLQRPEELKKVLKKDPHLVVLDNLEDEVQDLEWQRFFDTKAT